jgi:small nuclear ribonucleoprotein B and B'
MSGGRMIQFINKKLLVTLSDGREMVGMLLAFDKHMNVVLGDVTETRPLSKKAGADGASVTRTLGLILLRGQHILSVRAETKGELNLAGAPKGKGTAKPAS